MGLGAVGVVLPVMPTTPFVLLAAFCFSSGSKAFYEWLCRNRIFGQYIENYRTKQGITKRHKVASIIFMWMGMITSAAILRTLHVYIILLLVGTGVTIHLLTIKTKTD